jgi:hypothetical protein
VPDGGGTEGKEDKWREDMFIKVVEPLKSCHDLLVTPEIDTIFVRTERV